MTRATELRPRDTKSGRAASLDPHQVVSAGEGRASCLRCFRPRTHCYCAELPHINNRTEVIIVQHPRERFHPIGTARIAELALGRVRILVNTERRFSKQGALALPPRTGLLYPSAGARNLDELTSAQRPEHLVVLDGTWHHAHTLLRDIPALHLLPRYAFTPREPSRYRLRKEPRPDCVSTIEAIVHALTALEPDTPHLQGLLTAFTRMIDRQASWPRDTRPRRVQRNRAAGAKRLPRAFVEDFERVVVVYGEAVPAGAVKGSPSSQPPTSKRLAHWVARRLSSGECFEALPISPALISEPYRTHLGLNGLASTWEPESLAFQERWGRFLRPDDILVAWNPGTLAPLENVAPWRGAHAFLKSAYHAVDSSPGSLRPRRGGGGALDTIVQFEGLCPIPAPCHGRAAHRLANAQALCEFLHCQALAEA